MLFHVCNVWLTTVFPREYFPTSLSDINSPRKRSPSYAVIENASDACTTDTSSIIFGCSVVLPVALLVDFLSHSRAAFKKEIQ